MRSEVRNGNILYAIIDFIAAVVAWLLFIYFQQNELIIAAFQTDIFKIFSYRNITLAFILIPSYWLVLHLFSGAYFNPFRKSRIIEIYRTLIIVIIGILILYLIFFSISHSKNFVNYYQSFFIYFIIQFVITSIFRILYLNSIKSKINTGKFGYNTLIIGGNKQAVALYQEINNSKIKLGNLFKGFVYADENGTNGLSKYLPKLGSIDTLEKIIDEHHIEEIIIAIDTSEHNKLQDILARLSHRKVIIKITPDLYDIISGSVKTSNLFGAVLIEIYPELMPDWQRVLKRALDIVVSIFVLVLFSPLYLFAALKIKLSSPGSIFYKQSRIGLYGKSFMIYKFRSMVTNAEDNGPALSSENDARITKWGRVMRKWRIDELPQFFNILKGEMSIVGPRPERKYFIDIISQTNPHYKYLHKVKPGLSSWGMVKFGYAENVNEMIERMRYDLLYIKNCSLVLDFKIMIYTIIVILQGRGK